MVDLLSYQAKGKYWMKEYPKTFCEFCSKFISNNNIEKHKLSHLNNPNY